MNIANKNFRTFYRRGYGLIMITLLSFNVSFGAVIDKDSLSLSIKADHKDWVYKLGEKPEFTVTVLHNGKKSEKVKVKYQIGPEKMDALKSDSVLLGNKGNFVLKGYTMDNPGFLRYNITAEMNGKTVKSTATAAFSPEMIKPTIELPEDFKLFWQNSIKQLSSIPIDPKVEFIQESSTEKVNVYRINIQNIHRSRVYGILCVPKLAGKYPVVLNVPGAGIRGYKGDISLAEKGVITLQIGIHGIPVDMDAQVYQNLSNGGLYQYASTNLDEKENYYYKRVYLGCVRALDFLASLPEYDGKNMAVYGGSQGGALSIVTAALDSRVNFLGAYYPALCDLTGYLHHRAGGWPHLFSKDNLAFNNKKDKLETSKYYDVVNFAKQLTVPGFYTWGFNDETCPPTSMYAAYNAIPSPKELVIYKEAGHRSLPEQNEKMSAWLLSKLKQ
ncbi:cephalosporin-C deacetylase [Pedobacter sp. CG_S7]|uniref:acetylxylan esterase n=1 Tax=Pedobacter sp. CG_S7 TaxID=3143930 RepID=UPI003396450E